jgi:pimeloyl-ACP methyl ester carboxylesterase
MLKLMKRQAALVSRASQLALAWKPLVPIMARLGFLSGSVDVEALMDVAGDFKTMDFGIYSDLLGELGKHDARDLLPLIDIPLLILTGDRDLFTPVFTARSMNKRVPGSRLVVIPGGTHYTPIEYPEVIRSEVLRFLEAIPGWEPLAVQSAR